MFVEEDVAEDDVRYSVGFRFLKRRVERFIVRLPAAASDDAAQSKAIRLRVEDLGTKPMRSTARGVLAEHGDHAGEVVLIAGPMQGGATILAAAPGNGGARLASGQG